MASDYAKRVTDWPTLEIAVGARPSLVHGRPVRKMIFVWLCSVCFNVSGLGDFPRPKMEIRAGVWSNYNLLS